MIDLRLGDCFAPDGLPSLGDGSVDVVLTDPPFDARTHRAAVEAGDWRDGRRSVAGALPFAPLDDAAIATLAQHFARIARRWIVLFAGERQVEAWAHAVEAAGARFVRLGVVQRSNPRPQLSGDRPAPGSDFLVIAHSTSTAMRWNGGGRPATWTAPAARFDDGHHGPRLHPCAKSRRLMRALVEDFSDAGDLVLDPFAGSGSTAVACRETGRRFVGWELDAPYHATALRQIEKAREQLRLDVRAPGEQAALFGGR